MRKITVVAIHATSPCVLQKLMLSKGFPSGMSGGEHACPGRKRERHEFDPDIKGIPWGTAWRPTPVFLSGESQGQRSLAGYNP